MAILDRREAIAGAAAPHGTEFQGPEGRAKLADAQMRDQRRPAGQHDNRHAG